MSHKILPTQAQRSDPTMMLMLTNNRSLSYYYSNFYLKWKILSTYIGFGLFIGIHIMTWNSLSLFLMWIYYSVDFLLASDQQLKSEDVYSYCEDHIRMKLVIAENIFHNLFCCFILE